jgi:radical SAM protein with 4Fe4S-binding SPASM domain
VIFFNEIRKILSGKKREELLMLAAIRHFRQHGRISPYPPVSIQIQTHSACNGRCVYCPYPQLRDELQQGKMARPLFDKLIDDISRWRNPAKLTLMLQNEPLLDANFFEYIAYAKSRMPWIKVSTVTNGTMLNSKMVERLSNSGLDELTVSLDAFSKQTYESLHPGFSYEKTMGGIERLIKGRPAGLSVRFSIVLTNRNYHELQDFIGFARARKSQWRTVYLLNRADNVNQYQHMRLSKLKWYSIKLKLIHKYFYQTCPLPFARMSVLFNGDVLICCQDWQRKIIVGNAGRQSLQDIWTGEAYERLRRKLIQKQYSSIPTCSGCSVAQFSL